MLSDGIVFYDGKTKIIFNQYSFCEYVKWHIVKFAKKSYEEADIIVYNSFLCRQIETTAELYELLNHSAYHFCNACCTW